MTTASAARAVEANLFAFFGHLTCWPPVEVHDGPACLWTISDLPFPLFNSVMRVRCDEAELDDLIAARMESCRERRVPMLWWTGPSTDPAGLADRLRQLGFVDEPACGMAADLRAGHSTDSVSASDQEPDGIAIDRVRDGGTMAEWSRVLCEGFGAPPAFGEAFAAMAEGIGLAGDSPFRHYLARADGVAVATCSLFIGAGVAGIYDVATLPGRRRHGLGAAVTRFAMAEARTAGLGTAILHASQLGLGMYRSLGFASICDIGQHVWMPEDFTR